MTMRCAVLAAHFSGAMQLALDSVQDNLTEATSALILISPFRSAFTTAFPTPFPLFPGDRFPNHKRIKTINSPLLIIHGENDGVIPFSHGQKLFAASPATTKEFLKIPGAGHNDLFHVASKEIFTKIAEFALKEIPSD